MTTETNQLATNVTTQRKASRPNGRKDKTTVVRQDRSPFRIVVIVLIWAAVVFNIALIVWLLVQSVRDTHAILNAPWGLPKSIHFENYARAWTAGNFAIATWNSVWVTAVSSAITVGLGAPCAYYLSRVDSRFTRGMTLYFILGLGIPAQVIVIPLFVMLNSLYLTDSLLGLNIVYIGETMPFTVFLLTAFFRSLPAEMEEAASLDGTTPFQTFWRITLPLAKSGIMTAFVLAIIAHWNETLLAITLLQSTAHYTLPLAIIEFVQQQTYSGADWGGLMAGLVLVVVPMLIVFLWFGRRLTEGLTLGMGK